MSPSEPHHPYGDVEAPLGTSRLALLVVVAAISFAMACQRTRFAAVDVGGSISCGIQVDDNGIDCWGSTGRSDSPAGSFTQISIGDAPACAVDDSQQLVCWEGETPPEGAFVQVSCGAAHCCALRADGTITCWGNDLGAIGVPGGEFVAVSAGQSRTCALRREDSALTCWGQFGEPPPAGAFTSVSVGSAACAKGLDGVPICWDALDVIRAGTPQVEVRSIVSGMQASACAIGISGGVSCWGIGELVDDLPAIDDQLFVSVDLGASHGCGLLEADSTVSCWGRSLEGQSDAP